MAEIFDHGRKPQQCVCKRCEKTFFDWNECGDVCPSCEPPKDDPWSKQL